MLPQIRETLFRMQDTTYRAFNSRLLPTVDPERVIGVRTPELRALAKQLAKSPDADAFLSHLPHHYFEENQLHAFVLSECKQWDECIARLCEFLPHVDNWATCDQLSPKIFKKHTADLLSYIQQWMRSHHVYTVRFGIGMLMRYFLDDEFSPEYPSMVAAIRSDEYYINMMIAWYFATALAKQYDAVLPYIRDHALTPWTHAKAIQKARESYRISDERKAFLKGLKGN